MANQTDTLTAASGNYTAPVTGNYLIECIGGGSGGRDGDTQARRGGGGAAYAAATITYTKGQVIPYVVGQGSAHQSGVGPGGGNTTFNTSDVIAVGGGPTVGGPAVNCTGTTVFSGGTSGLGTSTTSGSGGGAAATAAGIGGAGAIGSGTTGGAGGTNSNASAGWGGNGEGALTTPATAGVFPGGSGGGGGFAVTGGAGANGANGVIYVTYTLQPTTFSISTASPTAINVPSAITATLDQVATSTVTISTTSSTGETIANFTVASGQTVSTGGSWTPLHAGSSTLTFTNDSSLTNPSPQVVTVSGGGKLLLKRRRSASCF